MFPLENVYLVRRNGFSLHHVQKTLNEKPPHMIKIKAHGDVQISKDRCVMANSRGGGENPITGQMDARYIAGMVTTASPGERLNVNSVFHFYFLQSHFVCVTAKTCQRENTAFEMKRACACTRCPTCIKSFVKILVDLISNTQYS